jgi:hypothetical protein
MEKKATSKRYPPELKERAVRMVKDLRQQDPGPERLSFNLPRTSRGQGNPYAPKVPCRRLY